MQQSPGLDACVALGKHVRFWWVNQNQTYRHELAGGYLWSPKCNANGARNPYYDFMRVVSPGDLVFSYADTLIKAIGLVRAHAYEAPKPLEFGSTGAYWEKIGWRVDVGFREMIHQVRPADYAEQIAKVLPDKYSPLRPNGFGLQNVYLTRVPPDLAETLLGLIGVEARNIANAARVADEATANDAVGLIQWEAHQIEQLKQDHNIAPTEREALVLARRGQGKFRQKVATIEKWCRITHVEKPEHLRASHCKPWRDSNNEERLDGENGLLLTPTIDHLFDRGFISFESNGDLLVSPVAHRDSLERMGVDMASRVNVGSFSSGQRRFLEFHRNSVFLDSKASLD